MDRVIFHDQLSAHIHNIWDKLCETIIIFALPDILVLSYFGYLYFYNRLYLIIPNSFLRFKKCINVVLKYYITYFMDL